MRTFFPTDTLEFTRRKVGEYPGGMGVKPDQPLEGRRPLQMVASMDELRREKWVPFTLGPIYVFGRLDFDVIARFHTETKLSVHVSYVDFMDFRVFDLPGIYAHRLYAMNDEAYPEFVKYLQSVEVIDRDEKRYFQLMRVGAPILDPFTRYLVTSVPKPETVDVITVMGLGGMIVPKTHVEYLTYPIFRPGEAADLPRQEFLNRLPRPITAPLLVEFEKKGTHPEIVQRGFRMLGGQL